MKSDSRNTVYEGVEVGPIRPPSEAQSLMLRLTRNCPWNRCKFCGLYKGTKFSSRSVDHIMKDIDTIREIIDDLQQDPDGGHVSSSLRPRAGRPEFDQQAQGLAMHWMQHGMESIFLQDANTLFLKPDQLVEILDHLRRSFPQVERITSYARSQTIARIEDDDMARLAEAGLNRIHIGMESGSNEVLDFVKKGADKETHVLAGQKVKRAGIQLSEYYMPGLGGVGLSRENALETADALNRIDPDFIRIRTLAVPEQVELFKDVQSGAFTPLDDVQAVEELLLMIDHLDGITSTIKSDHILNLFQEVEGDLPGDVEAMTAPIREFLAMSPEDQVFYRVGRRTGIFNRLEDRNDPELREHALRACRSFRVTPENIDEFTAEMISRFI